MIAYYRVDERVIHGQTLNVVTRQMACDGILVVDDEIAASGTTILMQSILNQVPINWLDAKNGKKPKYKASLD